MKKIILVVFMVLIFYTPSAAQVETDSFFSIKNTLWKVIIIGHEIGFADGKVYCNGELTEGTYTDLPLIGVSIVSSGDCMSIGYLSPFIGLGIALVEFEEEEVPSQRKLWFLRKLRNRWVPSSN